ncbi:MAG TPA: hypothetical protein VHG93_04910 [Longimicrobium sp.]|nr:hypothetical protein [Longimicrobium sp.]
MKIYPISVPRKPYRGRNDSMRRKVAQYNDDAAVLEEYLNERIEADPAPVQEYLYGFIARDVGMSVARVTEILFGVDCGHNGLTVAKSAEAWQKFINGPHGN